MDKDNYPTKGELNIVRDWDFGKRSVEEFLQFIELNWNYADIGYYELSGKKVLRLRLSTGGWSGNESMINAIQDNFTFWMICWEKSVRGGHYYFRICLKSFEE